MTRSHSIPDGFFRLLKKSGNGQFIRSPEGDGRIGKSQDTGDAPILCVCCEGKFNRRFDGPLVNAYKKWDENYLLDGPRAKIDFCPKQLAQGLASIFWRAAVSKGDLYSGFNLSGAKLQMLHEIIDADTECVSKMCTCSVLRLYDKRPKEEGGFSDRELSQIILPAHEIHSRSNIQVGELKLSLAVVFQGFLSSLWVPRLRFHERKNVKQLSMNTRKLHAPRLYVLDYPPMEAAMVHTVKKHIRSQAEQK